MYDVIVIGAGSVGSATARELSKYRLKTLVLERGHDICSGASKANTGMIHAGYDPIPGTNEAKFNAPGNRMMYPLCDELDVPYQKSGTTIFATDDSGMRELHKLKKFAIQNHVEAEIIPYPDLLEKQPDMGSEVRAILWVPEGGVTNPFSVTFALAENAYVNGVEFRLDSGVTGIDRVDRMTPAERELLPDGANFVVHTAEDAFPCRMIVNCAGLYSDVINNMVSDIHFKIIPRFGAHIVLDRKLSSRLTTTLMETPHDLSGGGHTKGMAIAPSIGGTMLLGCDATEVKDPDTTEWTMPSAQQIIEYFKKAWPILPLAKECPEFPMDQIIAVFGGCRPHADTNDFVIGEPEDAPNFVNAGGTESPAFTSSPAIGEYVAHICIDRLAAEEKDDFNPYRKGKKVFRTMTDAEKKQAIAEDPDYARIVCRCEMVTEAEIRDAIRRPLGARSVAGVKLRTRAGMGRCQGGFCSPRVVEILCEELGLDPLEVTQCGGNSQILMAPACSLKAENEEVHE